MIRIKSKRHLFRRCGMPHPKDWVEYPDDRFTDAELEILMAEPMLLIEVEEEEVVQPAPASIDVACLRAADDGKVTASGKPTVEAVEEILGREVSAAERDEAWARIDRLRKEK